MSDDECYYENGNWEWDEGRQCLNFIRHEKHTDGEEIILATQAAAGAVHFRDDVDVFEQMRFKNHYQRKIKIGQRDVVTLQDVKDVAIYTSPMSIMSEKLINMLHQSTTERFIRALILYCQYYLQISNVMENRFNELKNKIPTQRSKLIEDEYRENLCDLRVLVATEYCRMSIGAVDMKNYHHLGLRKLRSLSNQDAHLYETLLRMCIQIVWLALGRKAYNRIELEVNRLFKTDYFNSIEHNLHTKYLENMCKRNRDVLLGQCLRKDKKLNTRSPLSNEVFCQHRYIDFRLMSLGIVNHDKLTPRNLYLQYAIAENEETFEANNIVVGILGLKRSNYDPMLHPVSVYRSPRNSDNKQSSFSSKNKLNGQNQSVVAKNLCPDIILPPREVKTESLPETFPSEPRVIRRCNPEHRNKWLNRFDRILKARKSTATSSYIASRNEKPLR